MSDIKEICDFLKKYRQVKNKKLEEVCHLLKKFKKQKEEMKLRGFNDFNYIELLKGFDDENTHSKIIAEFLNPDGSHYQGKIFLENFFRTLDIPFNIDNWNVITERFVRNCVDKGQGRIDIYMTNGKKHIILENKIGAGDQEAQIFKYVECLYKENEDSLKPEDIFVLYLTKNKSFPSKYSLDNYEIKNGYLENNGEIKAKIKCISYDEIFKWMQENLKEVENITNLSEAIKQYIKVVKKILGEEENIMNLKDYLLKEEHREVLITLIENKNEFEKYVKNDEECQKIIEEEKLGEVLAKIIDEINYKVLDKLKNIPDLNIIIEKNENSKYIDKLCIENKKNNKLICPEWPYNFVSKYAFKELALEVLKNGENNIIEKIIKLVTIEQ
ncbi:PD-(D/E)XK nuclease family protein [Caminibacter pacificus]|uniref:PD-(D/E)XK nuclease superfamily protein n=1 Tax=Caminibacter pacificus TaxID=1424653 RepID=A0AAJ4REJ5_9BACT|nr:PD-(D/E)XK nuclease family protein [Caminibacter pacificus]QCI28045.1 hypothetical protein C6V80_03445 [Caminibacter pacificus]ROR41248.1 PD-(D/E)XK nuclease superfamily protein [Caminibacter pacificus]